MTAIVKVSALAVGDGGGGGLPSSHPPRPMAPSMSMTHAILLFNRGTTATSFPPSSSRDASPHFDQTECTTGLPSSLAPGGRPAVASQGSQAIRIARLPGDPCGSRAQLPPPASPPPPSALPMSTPSDQLPEARRRSGRRCYLDAWATLDDYPSATFALLDGAARDSFRAGVAGRWRADRRAAGGAGGQAAPGLREPDMRSGHVHADHRPDRASGPDHRPLRRPGGRHPGRRGPAGRRSRTRPGSPGPR